MKIKKTEKVDEGKVSALRAKLPGQPEVQIDEKGKLAVQLTVWAQNEAGVSEQYQVTLTDGDVERLLASLASPKTPEHTQVVGNFMQQNLRSILRLSALGSGVALAD
ncbi:hypothetical protein [Paracandidimonas soli]|uniref:Uncharacterized protein n=1 Tax=Paracandidimonas soli TaxID=1917182 RepID=A0A4R3VDS0_9BURK|nr:hypothetical protein [Paracandidimonas soli]TCV01852.1 hypothetical protein EV686_102566 [Paracandidimonas soli]